MPPDFLTPERKKNTYFGKLIRKKIQKNFIVNNNNNTIICVWYLSVHSKSDDWRNKQNKLEHLA